jgi:sugar porter (SP) family MFS transporter
MAENSWSDVSDSNRFVYLIAIVAALNGLLFGYDIGVISGALLYLDQTFTLSTFLKEVIVSSTLLAAAAGALIGGKFADYYGRRLMTFIGAVAFFIGSLVMALAPTVSWVIIGRIVAGLAIGIASIVGPMVIAEVSPPEIRGALGTLQQLAITVGILVGYFINYLFAAIIEGPAAWRWMLGFGMVLAAVLVIGMLKVPETPRWLVKHGREDDAREVLNRIRVDTDIEEELQDIKNIEKTEKEVFQRYFNNGRDQH